MNRFVFADASKCIGCRTCEVACAISHQGDGTGGTLQGPEFFVPRLKVIKNATVTTPVMCHQCEDAPCAQVCPNNAIVREDGIMKVIQSRCIGCKTCVIACPYGAMDVKTTMSDDTSARSLFAQRKIPKSQAIKCDLCSHRPEGPACVEVCPTNAIQLFDPDSVEQAAKNKREAAAISSAAIKM